MPLIRQPERCWILLVHSACADEDREHHRPTVDVFLPIVAELWARWPERDTPLPWLNDEPCLIVQCRVCGLAVGDGEHFADAEHAWEAAECDGWQEDVCPFCQPNAVSL
ncbi:MULTISPECIES: hypothetical protein [unclassified Micromonospora]|uniref:hypothetical protein n=1 Tax=unclassified Micromonospora TaxID=2617518 RepID=UPI00332E940F